MKRLQICLLGRFYAGTDSSSIELGVREAQLLAYLALTPDQQISRIRVAGALWSDYSERRARANLSTALWRLRAPLSQHGCFPEVIRVSQDWLVLDGQLCDIDVAKFKRCTVGPTARAVTFDGLSRAAHCISLYKGDLLEDWDVEWCRLDREEVRQRYLFTLRALSEAFEQRRRYDLALYYARREVDADPLNETAQRAIIRLLSYAGERASAVAQFNKFARLARSELGIDPDKETVALVGAIRKPSPFETRPASGDSADIPTALENVPLIGRQSERNAISCLLGRAVRGTGGGALILGEAGIGKSKLANWAMEEWAARGGALGQGRCVEFNEPVPYQPLLDALRGVSDARDVAEFLTGGADAVQWTSLGEPIRAGVPDEASEQTRPLGKLRMFAWLASRLAEVGLKRPLLLILEDLQWVDAGTLDFLVYLLENARNIRLAIILTSRPSGNERHSKVIERLSRYCSTILRLGPLSKAETTRFIESLVGEGRIAASMTKWIHEETEGNPLFVLETLRLFQQRSHLRSANAPVIDIGGPLNPNGYAREIPEGVRSAVEQRLAFLEPSSLRIAQIASVLGRSFDEELLHLVAGVTSTRLSRAVLHLLRAGIFERENTAYRFTHDKIRSVCYESLPLDLRKAFHARAAVALAQVPDVALHRLAWHQHSAGRWSLAATTWEHAGDHAKEVYASEDALSAYRHAISCLRRSTVEPLVADSREASILLKLDEVLSVLGKPDERTSVLKRVHDLCRLAHLHTILPTWYLRRASLEEHVGNFGAASALSKRAWFLARVNGSCEQEVEALRILAWALNRSGRHERSGAISRLALRKLGDTKSPTLVATLWQAAVVHVKLSRFLPASVFLDKAEMVALELGLRRELHYIWGARAVLDKWTGRVHASRGGLMRALQIASEGSDPIGTARSLFHLATIDTLEGKIGDSIRKLRRAITLSRSIGYTRTYLACLNNIAYGTGRLLGNYQWAWAAASHALRLAETTGSRHLTLLCKDSLAMLLIERGRLHEAMILTDEVLHLVAHEKGSMGPNQESVTRRGAIWLQLGEPERAVLDLEVARQNQLEKGDRLILVDTLTYLALAYAKLGEADRALATSGEALRLLGEISYANMQPQRIFWHHYQILELFGREPRLPYLERAVEFIATQAATLSRAQQLRFEKDVPLNRAIREAWERQQTRHSSSPSGKATMPETPMKRDVESPSLPVPTFD